MLYVTRGDGDGHVGGAAVLVNMKSDSVHMRDGVKCGMDGRVCRVPVSIDGINTRITSIYAPVDPRGRRRFLDRLDEERWLHRDDIVGGDFNCVADVTLDTATIEGGSEYSNAHGMKLENIMLTAGLCDTYRR